jgi:DNA-binding LacI/PurR family transcriptional regulator
MARVTLQTVADRVGVSRMTVSNAFSRPDQLSTELRTRILAAARALGYSGPDPAGRALARGTTGAIGVLLTDSLRYAFTDEIATGFLGAVVDELASTGLALTLLTTNEHGDAIPARDVAIDGALVYSCQTQSPAREWLVRRKLPLVFVDQDPVPGIASVNVDDRAGARAAATHLLDLGHRRIGIISRTVVGNRTDVDLTSAGLPHPQRHRMLGWLDALHGAGIDPVVTAVARHDSIEAEEAALELLSRPDRPTALLCFSDVFAIGALNAARRLGLDVPGDLSVVGFDDSPVARRSSPALTTVRQDVEAKGRLAAEALKAEIARNRLGTTGKVRHHVLPTELIVRASTGPVPAST